MSRLILLVLLIPIVISAKSEKPIKFTSNFKHSIFSVQQKKKKIILSCKPLKSKNAGNNIWISECNNVAYNLLSQEKYQKILVEKYIEDNPFGKLSYQAAQESGTSYMKKKSIRKSFKIITN